ncbi:MFS general substrate transporter [Westerdykella ornata]|uniref:MFS general substrate transporter n=1 Tax=Westerdykella ornata TaxID=318751 RepID=A0A6A6J8B3_WESOR|nr:MFS general substrate transporter [Westerdykella ornata]KAF2271449.1 MFS general substrate transporter [Westerdykella ornata]
MQLPRQAQLKMEKTPHENASGIDDKDGLGSTPVLITRSVTSEQSFCRYDEARHPSPNNTSPEALPSLPKVVDRIPFAAWAVIFAGAFERFAYFGLIAPWQNYMQHPRKHTKPNSIDVRYNSLPGALGLGQAMATNMSNAFFLISFLTPMFFAVLSDSKLGRYKTLMLGLACYLVGCVVITATSTPRSLEREAGLPGLVVSMAFVALGAGSIKACYAPFLGDQIVHCGKEAERVEKIKGRLVVVSRERTLQFVYNAYYCLASIPVTYLEHRYGFWQAYLLATGALVVSIMLFLLWGGWFIKLEPQGNMLPQASRVLVCSMRSGLRLDHAKPAYQEARSRRIVPWTDEFVEEIKQGLVACRVIFCLLFFYLVVSQMYNNLVSQAGSMRLSGIPNDLPQAFSGVACIIFGPLIQWLYSVLARNLIELGPIARLVSAFVFCGLSMVYAAVLQRSIYASSPCFSRPLVCSAGAGKPNNISVFLQIPTYFLLAIGEILGFVTAFEYAYRKAPTGMKAIVMAFSQLTAGLASALGMAVSPAAKDPNMVVLYAVLAGVMGANAALFWWIFRRLDRVDGREMQQNDIEEENDRQGASL